MQRRRPKQEEDTQKGTPQLAIGLCELEELGAKKEGKKEKIEDHEGEQTELKKKTQKKEKL